jgi:hypothetical protein
MCPDFATEVEEYRSAANLTGVRLRHRRAAKDADVSNPEIQAD